MESRWIIRKLSALLKPAGVCKTQAMDKEIARKAKTKETVSGQKSLALTFQDTRLPVQGSKGRITTGEEGNCLVKLKTAVAQDIEFDCMSLLHHCRTQLFGGQGNRAVQVTAGACASEATGTVC